MAKKKQHGGKRAGAGRKPSSPEGPTVLVSATVPEALVEQLDALADKNGWNRSQAVTAAIRGLVATPNRG
ncbi:MAG: CopG family transcriptional regulator [Pirellulales bacterium]|nr:CopG family transcriptional regulator [Pirellulales bacterium]